MQSSQQKLLAVRPIFGVRKMFVTLSDEMEVKVPASVAWDVYSGLGFAKISSKLLPEMFQSSEALQGNGGVGTVVLVNFPPDASGTVYQYKEKFTVIDNQKRVKVAEAIEGGYLDQGLDEFRVRFQVMEKQKQGEDSSIIKVTVEYKTEDFAAASNAVAALQNVKDVMEVVDDYLAKSNIQAEVK